MAGTADTLAAALSSALGDRIKSSIASFRELTIVIAADTMIETLTTLRDHSDFRFDMLLDVECHLVEFEWMGCTCHVSK